MNRLYQRPSPEELKELLPGVYECLSEEVKVNGKGKEVTALFRVYNSLLMATAEQLMLVEKVWLLKEGNDLIDYSSTIW